MTDISQGSSGGDDDIDDANQDHIEILANRPYFEDAIDPLSPEDMVAADLAAEPFEEPVPEDFAADVRQRQLREQLATHKRHKILDISELELRTRDFEAENFLAWAEEFGARFTRLDLSRNRLTSAPDGLQHFVNLAYLNLSGNRLENLPRDIEALSEIEEIDLESNALTSIPSSLYKLPGLRRLRLSGNHLRRLEIPSETFPSLTELYLAANRISTIVKSDSEPSALEVLDLSSNLLKGIPQDIRGFKSLTSIDLHGNEISYVAPAVGELTMLRTIDLSFNQLVNPPKELGQLGSLVNLNLSTNQIAVLPSEIGQLAKLTSLNLKQNQIRSLSPELGALSNKVLISLDDNPLDEQFGALYERGTKALLTYLRSLDDGKAQYEAKLLLVGEGGVGKSSLVAALRSEDFVSNRPTTHGIEIDKLHLPHPNVPGAEITLNSWDFGGQEVYRISHQFFFSRRSLFLVVWKPREGQEENSVESWCRRIRLRVGDAARIMIVSTHSDERRAEFDFRYLQEKFPNVVVDYIAVDSQSGEGLEELREAIAYHAANLPQMGERLSSAWVDARNDVSANARSYISRAKLERICAERGISEDETETFAALLHDLGYVIHYADDQGLRDLVVIQPEWLTKAIGYVLEDSATRTRAGILPHDALAEIWRTAPEPALGYEAQHYPYFLRLMEKFDISFRLPDERSSLVAQLVPYERPQAAWRFAQRPAPVKRRIMQATCRMSEEAPGLVSWLTVRNHRFSTGVHWRRGVLLRHEAYNCDALYEASKDGRDLRVTVVGPAPDYFFHVLKDGLEDLIQNRWKGLRYTFIVPCPHVSETGSRCRGSFSFKSLTLFRAKAEPRIICSTCASWTEVSALLTGFTNEPSSLESAMASMERTQRMLATQLDRIEVHAAETARQVRNVSKILSNEVTDCPRVFTFFPEDRSRALRAISTKRRFVVKLWCEEFGGQHPWDAASYVFRPTKEWVDTAGPYIRFIGSLLRIFVPIVGAVYAVTLSEVELRSVRSEIELTKTLAEKFPNPDPARWNEGSANDLQGMSQAEGAGLRSFRSLMLTLDPHSKFGGLRRATTSSGDIIWVCPDHYRLYDPGLPIISS